MKPSTIVGLVSIVFMMLASSVALKALGESIEIIITLMTLVGVPVLAAFGVKFHENLQEIKSNTNGNNVRQMDINQEQQKAFMESLLVAQKTAQENMLQMQRMMTQIALTAQPIPPAVVAEITEEPRSDNTSQIHVP